MTAAPRFIVRYGVTLVANLARMAAGFVSAMLLASGLGAASYGDFSFLLASFMAVGQLLEMGTSSAFYTLLSRERRGAGFFAYYGGWLLLQFLLPLLVVGVLLPDAAYQFLFVGQSRGLGLLALATAFTTAQVWPMVIQLGEARRRTITVQTASAAQALAHVGVIWVLTSTGWLAIATAFAALAAEHAVLAVLLLPVLLRENIEPGAGESASRAVGEFAAYCAPLAVYGGVSFAYTFIDRWLLQHFGGSVQQGYFAIGQQIAAISLLATTSVLRVFWKEVTEARHRGDGEAVRRMYQRVSRSLYFAAAWLSLFLMPFSRDILRATVGDAYTGGALTLMLMLLFPLHQALGQIQGTFFYASANTKPYVTLGITSMLVSIPVSIVTLGSATAPVPGLDLGAAGLAIKMVTLQVIFVNIQGWMLARINGWPFDAAHQIYTAVSLAAVALVARAGANVVGLDGVPALALAASVYVPLTCVLLWSFPQLVGLTRDEARGLIPRAARFA